MAVAVRRVGLSVDTEDVEVPSDTFVSARVNVPPPGVGVGGGVIPVPESGPVPHPLRAIRKTMESMSSSDCRRNFLVLLLLILSLLFLKEVGCLNQY
jgi:hypothetical protein